MTFANEKITKNDIENYSIDEIDEKLFPPFPMRGQWTIDRESGNYLRQIANGREEFSNISDWHVCWEGKHLTLRVKTTDVVGEYGGAVSLTREIVSMDGSLVSPSEKQRLFGDLREAWETYGDGGIYAKCSSFELKLMLAKVGGEQNV